MLEAVQRAKSSRSRTEEIAHRDVYIYIYIYIYIYVVCIHMCICVYIYTYI